MQSLLPFWLSEDVAAKVKDMPGMQAIIIRMIMLDLFYLPINLLIYLKLFSYLKQNQLVWENKSYNNIVHELERVHLK